LKSKKRYLQLDYRPLPYLRAFHNQRHDYFTRAIITGYGGGKTYAACHEFLIASAINKGVPNIIIEPTFQMVKDILKPTLVDILEKYQIPYYENKSEHNFYFPLWNGIIWLRSGDKPEKLKGINAGLVGIDEPFIQDENIYKIAISRSRHPKAALKGLVLTGTPEQLNWGYELIKKKSDSIAVYEGSTYDNIENVGADYIDNLKEHYSEKEVQAYVYGKFLNLTTGLVYYPFSQERNVIPRFSYLPNRPLEISCDFNISLMSWHIGQEVNAQDYTFDFIELTGEANTNRMCELLKQKYPHHSPGFIFYVDIAGNQRRTSATQTDIAIIRENFPSSKIFFNTIHRIKDRVDALNARLCNGNGVTNYFITENCTRLIQDYERVTWELMENKNKAGDLTHASDGESYKFYHKYPLIGRIESHASDYR